MVGGQVKFYPLQKGGREQFKPSWRGGGGGTTSFGVVLTQVLEVLTILEGGTNGFHPVKGGGGGKGQIKYYPVLH